MSKERAYIQRAFDFADGQLPEEEPNLRRLREAVAPYLDVNQLRQLAAGHGDIYAALRSDAPPAQVLALIETLSALLQPPVYEQIRSPHDVAALLMVEMGHLDQEELRTVLLDTRNRVQDIVTIYRGSLNVSLVRIGEIYKPAVRKNSASIIL